MINDSTENKILQAATKLFYENSSEKVTMRDIAAECGISPGNLTYYFRKKEDLFAVIYQDMLVKEYERYSEGFQKDAGENPWIFFVAANYAHLRIVAGSEKGMSDYIYATRYPSAREAYISANSDLLYKCLADTRYAKDRKKVHIASLAGCGGEFVALYTYKTKRDEYSFDELIFPTLSVRMLLLDVHPGEINSIIEKGKGKTSFLTATATSLFSLE